MLHQTRRRLIGNKTPFREHPAIQALNAVICCPCSLIGAVSHGIKRFYETVRDYELPSTKRKKALQRARYEWEKTQPRNLAFGRSRCLSFDSYEEECTTQIIEGIGRKHKGLDQKIRRRRKTRDQIQSPLFKLPLELREQIWEEVLGGYIFHINYLAAYRRMTHTRCKAADHRICRHRYFQLEAAGPDAWGLASLLALSLSCRRLYREAIHILYSRNTFLFHQHPNVLKLFLTIPVPRIHQIKTVSWTCRPHASSNTIRRNLIAIDLTEISNRMPWLDCKKNEVPIIEDSGCICVDCWTEKVYKDSKTQQTVLRRWLEHL